MELNHVGRIHSRWQATVSYTVQMVMMTQFLCVETFIQTYLVLLERGLEPLLKQGERTPVSKREAGSEIIHPENLM